VWKSGVAPSTEVVGRRMWKYFDINAHVSNVHAYISFEHRTEADPTAVYNQVPVNAPAQIGQLVYGSFRGLIYGVDYSWSRCPGVLRFSPFLVCSTRTQWEQGRCEWLDGVDNYGCVCNHGFFHDDCSGICPGGYGNICSNHGNCSTFNETFCICNYGWRGPSCEFMCPGFDNPQKPRECLDFGDCVLNDEGTAAVCICHEETNRYSEDCGIIYGDNTSHTVETGCENCAAPHETCIAGACICEEGFYRYFGVCKAPAASLAPHMPTLLAVLITALFAHFRRDW